MTNQGTKRSKSFRICEYFNEDVAEIYPQKTGSDYTRHPKCAENYLDVMSFSRSELIDQLEYEGFTHDQAVHGVNEAY